MDKNGQTYTNNLLEIPDFLLPNKVVISRVYMPWKKCANTFYRVIRQVQRVEKLESFDIGYTHFDYMDITDTPISESMIHVYIGGEHKGTVNYKYGEPDSDNIEQYVEQIINLIWKTT